MRVWRNDGVPASIPMFVTESNLSSSASETYMDIFAAIWLADYVGAFFNSGGKGLYLFHYLPLQMEHGCNDSPGTFGMFTVDANYQIQQPLGQFFVSQLINLDWVKPGNEVHRVFPAESDIEDGAGHALVTAYALERPGKEWSLLVVNRDQLNSHAVRVEFEDERSDKTTHFTGQVAISVFGSGQYQWHPAGTLLMGHSDRSAENPVIVNTKGHADPDGPLARSTKSATAETIYEIPAASVVVLRGKLHSM